MSILEQEAAGACLQGVVDVAVLVDGLDGHDDPIVLVALGSGDLLLRWPFVRSVDDLPEPVRGDLLAVPVTGAYTLAMSSTYNAVPRPAAVLVGGGDARLIRRRETVDDLLAYER